MTTCGAVHRARTSYRERAWAAAYADFIEADSESPLGIEDLERLVATAYLIGKDDESLELWTRAHRQCLRLGEVERAGRSPEARGGSPGCSGCSMIVILTAPCGDTSWPWTALWRSTRMTSTAPTSSPAPPRPFPRPSSR